MKYNEFYLTKTDGFCFFVRQWLPDTAPKGLILLVHGLSDHGGRFAFVAEAFAGEGYIFTAPDLRGNGKSDGKRGHFASLGQVMEDIRYFLQECRKAHLDIPVMLYSQSMGGNLAINFSLQFPGEIHGLVASSPWLRLTKPPSAIVESIASKMVKIFPSLLIPVSLKARELCHDKVICTAYDHDPLIHWKISLSTFFVILKSGEWAIAHASELKIPLLLMHSKADPITSFAASLQFYQNANDLCTFVEFKDLYHELHNEAPKAGIVGNAIKWINKQLFDEG